MNHLFAFFFLATLQASASVLVTYAEDPNAYKSNLADASVFDFNKLSTGRSSNVAWDGVGTFDKLFVARADAFGGAPDATNPNGSLYSVQGASRCMMTTTLYLNTDSSYFGMWWSGGDCGNVVSLYDGDNLVSRFSTASLMDSLPADYDGNPINRKINTRQPYAFINFFGDETTKWDRIVFTNTGTSRFEADNYTSRVAGWNPATDGALSGIVVASVTGNATTRITGDALTNTRWSLDDTAVCNAPGAPVPPWVLLGAFGAVTVFRCSRKPAAA